MKLLLRILSILGIFLLFSGIVFFIFIPNLSPNVHLVSVSQKMIKDDIEINASIKSEYQYTLYSPAEGIVKNLQYHLGEQVSKDQVLAKVEKELDKLTDSQTETRLDNLVSQYSLEIQQSNEELSRINNAVSAGVLPRYKGEEVRSTLDRAKAKLIAAEKELNSYRSDKRKKQELKDKQTLIKALSKGVIIKKSAHEGQWVRRGDAIVSIVSTNDLTIKAMMSPQQVRKLALGQGVTVLKNDSKISWKERVLRVSPIISQDPNTKNLQEVTISLINADDIGKSINEKVKIKIQSTESNNNTISLPIEAVIRNGKEFHVLHVDKNKKASLSEVYAQNGFIALLQQFKCQFTACNFKMYGVSKKTIKVGNSDLNRVQIIQELEPNIQIILPKSGINENSLVILENKR